MSLPNFLKLLLLNVFQTHLQKMHKLEDQKGGVVTESTAPCSGKKHDNNDRVDEDDIVCTVLEYGCIYMILI